MEVVGKKPHELMVGNLPSVSAFIKEMAEAEQVILAQAQQKMQTLSQDRSALGGDHLKKFHVKRVDLTPAKRNFYHQKNLQVDYQFAVHKLRQEMGLDQARFAYKAGYSLEHLKEIEAGEALPTTAELLRFAEISGRSVHLRFD